MKQPFLQFYTGDHLRDPGIRSVSLAARGLWTDMLCLMHQSVRKGYLQHPSGHPITPVQLARMVGHAVDEVAGLLRELEDSGVFSRTKDGVLYSRRMVRDEQKRQKCSEAGKRGGGNPVLTAPLKEAYKGPSKGEVKGPSKGGVKPQNQRSESEKEEEANASLSAAESAADERASPGGVTELFHQLCPSLPRLREMSEDRKRAVRARWQAAGGQGLTWFEELFRAAEASDFLSGRSGEWAGCSFDWLMLPKNARKVLEGNYANERQLLATKGPGSPSKPPTQRTYTDTEL